MILLKIECPICGRLLTGKFTPAQDGIMARWYWYCFYCKVSVLKSIKKGKVV